MPRCATLAATQRFRRIDEQPWVFFDPRRFEAGRACSTNHVGRCLIDWPVVGIRCVVGGVTFVAIVVLAS